MPILSIGVPLSLWVSLKDFQYLVVKKTKVNVLFTDRIVLKIQIFQGLYL